MPPTRSALFALGIANLAFFGGLAPGVIIGLAVNLYQVGDAGNSAQRFECTQKSADVLTGAV